MSDPQNPRGTAAEKPGAGTKPVRKERPPRKITTGYRASVPFQRLSATKIRRVADNVRRKPYVEAMALLDVLPHKGARLLRKLIQSAAANALAQNKNLDEQMLYVKELLIDVGPTMKRMWARGRGRADRLLKRSCHISVVVDEIGAGEKAGEGRAAKAAGAKGATGAAKGTGASKEGVSDGSEG